MEEIVRGHIGYDGLVMTDDLSMKALSGTFRERTEAAFAAGCDMALHCNGGHGGDGGGRRGALRPGGRGPAPGRSCARSASATSRNRSILWMPAPGSMPRLRWSPKGPKLRIGSNELSMIDGERPYLSRMSSRAERAESEPALLVDVDGFEGPLDLLLELARRQKVDLHRISILALAEQYITFIEAARRMRLELAADYLVMAAWLAYLKSRLLLPEPPKGEEPSAEDLATALALRLRRLEAIREAAKKMGERDWLGRDVFARGAPEPVIVNRGFPLRGDASTTCSRPMPSSGRTSSTARVSLHKRNVWSLAEAREALERLVGHLSDWVTLDAYLLEYMVEPSMRPTVLASALSATLEMVREGKLSVRQDEAFAPLWVKAVADPAEAGA